MVIWLTPPHPLPPQLSTWFIYDLKQPTHTAIFDDHLYEQRSFVFLFDKKSKKYFNSSMTQNSTQPNMFKFSKLSEFNDYSKILVMRHHQLIHLLSILLTPIFKYLSAKKIIFQLNNRMITLT